MKKPQMSLFSGRAEKDNFIENFAMLLSAGVDIGAALEAVKKDIKSPRTREAIDKAQRAVDHGSPAWKALEDNKLLPHDLVVLVRIGEQTGRLPENLKVIRIAQEKERNLRSKLVSAMVYPAIVLSLTMLVGFSVSVFLLPRLSTLLTQLNVPLPWITRLFVSLGRTMSHHGVIIVPAFLLGFFGLIYFLFINPKTRNVGVELLFRIPGIRKLMREIQLARMGYLLGTLLGAGLPVVDAFDSMAQVATYKRYQKFFVYCKKAIERGRGFDEIFKNYPKSTQLVPSPIQQLLIAAAQTGNLSETLLRVGQVYEERSDNTSKNLVTAMEPILLFIVWLGVLGLALSVILPIYHLVGGVNK